MTTAGGTPGGASSAGNRRGRETRRRILEAATVCFQDRGMKLTLDDVAQAAGTTRMTVHRHTGGREPLITHLVLRESAQLADDLRTVLDADVPFAQRLVDALVLAVETIRGADHLQDLFAGRMSTSTWPDTDPDDLVIAAIHAFFFPYIADAADQGLLRVGPEESLLWILNQVLMFMVLPVTAPDAESVRSSLEMFVMPAILTR